MESSTARYKDRFLAKLGTRSIFINVEDIACFQADNKIVYLIDREGNRFVINYTLENWSHCSILIIFPHQPENDRSQQGDWCSETILQRQTETHA